MSERLSLLGSDEPLSSYPLGQVSQAHSVRGPRVVLVGWWAAEGSLCFTSPSSPKGNKVSWGLTG